MTCICVLRFDEIIGITIMQHDGKELPDSLADVWRAAEQQRTQEIGSWIKSSFASKERKAESLPKPISQGATARA